MIAEKTITIGFLLLSVSYNNKVSCMDAGCKMLFGTCSISCQDIFDC